MILGFKKQFVDKILSGSKIHTIREDKPNRWRMRNVIHFATGIRSKYYNQFKKGQCKSVQHIRIRWIDNIISLEIVDNPEEDWRILYAYSDADRNSLGRDEMEQFAINDGFESIDEFFKWFDKDFTGKIIHWTNKTY